MAGTGNTAVFCPAGRFTKVIDTSNLHRTYHTDAGSAVVKWHRYSAGGDPPYWEGTFTGGMGFFFPPDPYIRLEFNPSIDVTVQITIVG